MKTKKTILFVGIVMIALVTFVACGEKNTKDVKVDAAEIEKAAAELKAKAAQEEAELKAAKERVEDSLRKVDSLQQVKEHGHAH